MLWPRSRKFNFIWLHECQQLLKISRCPLFEHATLRQSHSLSLSLSLSLCQTQFYNLYSSTHIFNLSFLSLSLSPTETLKQTFTIFLAYTFNLSTSLGNLKIVFLHHIFNLSLFSLSLSLSLTHRNNKTNFYNLFGSSIQYFPVSLSHTLPISVTK